jgi:hypothetical protein
MNSLNEVLRQVVEGADFDPPDKLLRNVKADQACKKPDGFPYSIATNVAHADHWNRIWLAKLTGAKAPPTFPDFPVISEEEWDATRSSFLQNLELALELSAKEGLGEREIKHLLKIAVHTSYHLGQIKLLKRLLRPR